MFVTLVVFAFTLFTGFCEEYHVAVRLLLPTAPEEGTQTCQLLRSRSPKVWDKGGILRCIARQPITTVEGKVIVPYSITVNSSKLDNFPEAAKYADKVAFINQMLNWEVDSCLTVTGSNWCKPLNIFDPSFALEVHTKENVNGSKTLECDDLLDEMFSTNKRFSKVSCRDERYETKTLDVHHPHKLILQLRISPDRDRPPTKDISISLLNVVSKLGSNQSNCIQVDSVNRDPSRNSWTAIVNVHVTAETPPSCDMFGDRTPQISFACESLAAQGNEDDRRFKLDYSDDLNSQLMDPLDNIEAQLFIHWYLNEQLMGCPVIQYNLTKHHFNKAAVITGPIPETFCQEMREETHFAAHSCAARVNIGNKSAQIENAIYYLRPQEPFYQFDLPWYLNKYNELINQMNEHKQKCEFNGFIKLYQGDEVRKR